MQRYFLVSLVVTGFAFTSFAPAADEATATDKISKSSSIFFVDANIRFYPRTVTFALDQPLVLKILVTSTNSLDVGENRSNLFFRTEPINKIENETIIDDIFSISFKSIPVYGVTIPIINRRAYGQCRNTDFSFKRYKI